MKKELFLIATVATMLTACVNTDTFREVNDSNESAIGFSTFANKQTKAENSTQDSHEGLATHHTSFNVWAAKTYGSGWTDVYSKGTGGVATGTVSYAESKWSASPLKFWDKSATQYQFFAAAPADASKWTLIEATEGDYTTNYLKYTGLKLGGRSIAGNAYVESFNSIRTTDLDIMIAEPAPVDRAAYNQSDPAAVTLLFDHVLSRLNVKVKRGTTLTTNNVTVNVTSFVINGNGEFKNKGNFDESLANSSSTPTLQSGTIARWVEAGNSPVLDGTYTLTGVPADGVVETSGSEKYIGQFLIIPQTVTWQALDRATGLADSDNDGDYDDATTYPSFKIEYTLNGEPYFAYYNLAYAFSPASNANLTFCEGYMNNLTITIDADAITFTPEVYKWIEKTSGSITEVE